MTLKKYIVTQPEEILGFIPSMLGFHPTNHLVIYGVECGEHSRAGSETQPLIKLNLHEGDITERVREQLVDAIRLCAFKKCFITAYVPRISTFLHTPRAQRVFLLVSEISKAIACMWEEKDPKGWRIDCFIADKEGYMDMMEEEYTDWENLPKITHEGKIIDIEDNFEYEPKLTLRLGKRATREAVEKYLEPLWEVSDEEVERQIDDIIRTHLEAEEKQENENDTEEHDFLDANEENYRRAAWMLRGLRHHKIRDKILHIALAHKPLVPLAQIDSIALLEKTRKELPNIDRARKMRTLLDDVARIAPYGQVQALAGSAYLSWWMGNMSYTAARAFEAVMEDPDYSLAQLLYKVTLCAALPPWLKVDQEDEECCEAVRQSEDGVS